MCYLYGVHYIVSKETDMRYLLLTLALFSMSAMADTVVNYDDGSTYTLSESQNIFIGPNGDFYTKRQYNDGGVHFKVAKPSSRRDYVEVDNGTDDDMVVGSNEWCESYVPWSEGYTFTMQWWQRTCDTNGDGVYNQCDYYQPTGAATFEEIAWQDQCNNGDPWDGS